MLLRQALAGGARRRRRRIPRSLWPAPAERALLRVISARIEVFEAGLREQLLTRLASWAAEIAALRPDRMDTAADELADVLHAIALAIEALGSELDEARGVAREVARWNQRQINRQIRAVIGVDLFAAEPWLESTTSVFARKNAALIKDVTTKGISDVSEIVSRGLQQGTPARGMAKEIEDRLGVTKRRARTIARDQVASLNGEITRNRQSQLGIKSYVWRTSMDERVREEHAAREGEEFKWESAPSGGHPGEDINCRCTAEPVMDRLFEDL